MVMIGVRYASPDKIVITPFTKPLDGNDVFFFFCFPFFFFFFFFLFMFKIFSCFYYFFSYLFFFCPGRPLLLALHGTHTSASPVRVDHPPPLDTHRAHYGIKLDASSATGVYSAAEVKSITSTENLKSGMITMYCDPL
jgi:hypothetical protein